MPVCIIEWYTRKLVESNPSMIFVYGDNDMRIGMGGQAGACRGLPNTIGVRTKKCPGMGKEDFYSDTEYFENAKKITADFQLIRDALARGENVAFPKDGLGTGLSELPTRAPRTFAFVRRCLDVVTGGLYPSCDSTPT